MFHLRVDSSKSFCFEKFVTKPLKKSQKFRRNRFENNNSMYDGSVRAQPEWGPAP